jgi:hypothetical protein
MQHTTSFRRALVSRWIIVGCENAAIAWHPPTSRLNSLLVDGITTVQKEQACPARNPVACQTLAARCEAPNMITNSRFAALVSAPGAFVLAEPAKSDPPRGPPLHAKPEQDCHACH